MKIEMWHEKYALAKVMFVRKDAISETGKSLVLVCLCENDLK